jgi:putative phage-type endonuclease
MTYTATTRGKETLEEFLARRAKCVGGSDIASVMNIGKYACSRKLFFDKTGVAKDKDDSDNPLFRRGHRQEPVAASYYEELTGRDVRYTTPMTVPGKPHLSVTMDRMVFKKEDLEHENPGYLEIKTVGLFSMKEIKKNGLTDDYSLQLQYGMAVSGYKWGSFAIFCPDSDELLHWDVEADKELGQVLLDRADDWWTFHRECEVIPDTLAEAPKTKACEYCPWLRTCLTK